MKKFNRTICYLLVCALILAFFPTTIKATETTKDNIPTKVRMYSGNYDDDVIKISLADTTQTITNIKTNSKNAVAKITSTNVRYQEGEDAEVKNEIGIGIYVKKKGTYTVSFDIVDADKKKVSTKKVKVYAYGSVLKSISVGGKEKNSNVLTTKSGKVKVTLESGNKITKLEYGVYSKPTKDSSGTTKNELTYKTFKNGAKITYGTRPYYYGYEYDSEYNNYYSNYMDTSMVAPTYIRITYTDKYTKQKETMTLYYYRVIE
ncbi:hypothetical protein [Anaerosporobacter faecicola]|uniref:hypothetical protein n=1 Tax=Anaerosporobacter faecicola TaxID=2718714 RepID=UPI001439BE2F|nr:hypothetical protein [Anaerosporobacter faecicola]